TEAIIKTVAESDIFCRHFHIPLQSGDDLILKKMRRPYTRSIFRKLLYKIHELIPDAAIGVDTVIGFPGETEKAFENTYNLIEELPATYLHVFPFSSRKGTPASSFPDKVPSKIIKERCKTMRDLGNIKKKEFYKKNIGKKVEVLIEAKRDKATGFLKGMTSNYLPIFLSGNDDLKNTIVDAKIKKINNDDSLFGTI
ncbi:MAG: radical SAM protein, partial [Desulfobacterales bacterium]|nr:radical SAM protein [Desulfobacterales bacterium]